MSFVHLQVASSFSLLSSTISINGLVHKAKELGFKALALTDQNMMYGVVPFYKQCLKEGIKTDHRSDGGCGRERNGGLSDGSPL